MKLSLENAKDLPTTLPALYIALAAVLVSFGITLPALPSWAPTVVSIIGGLVAAHLTFGTSSKPAAN